MLGELLLVGYSLFAAYLIAARAGWFSALFMLLYAASFAAVIGVTLWQNRPADDPRQPVATPATVCAAGWISCQNDTTPS
jgi:predicted membrane metal-binding protein